MKLEHAIIKKMSEPNIIFHIQNEQDTICPLSFFTRIMLQYLERDFLLFIECPDLMTLSAIDTALWLFPRDRFIPRVLNTHQLKVGDFNVKDKLATFNVSFECITPTPKSLLVECIPNMPALKSLGRKKYKHYSKTAHPPKVSQEILYG